MVAFYQFAGVYADTRIRPGDELFLRGKGGSGAKVGGRGRGCSGFRFL